MKHETYSNKNERDFAPSQELEKRIHSATSEEELLAAFKYFDSDEAIEEYGADAVYRNEAGRISPIFDLADHAATYLQALHMLKNNPADSGATAALQSYDDYGFPSVFFSKAANILKILQ